MAWNGSRGNLAGQPGFVSYTAFRDSPLEEAVKTFMISHANLPRRARLWTFGAGMHVDNDGWSAVAGTKATSGPGILTLYVGNDGKGALESPDDLGFKPADYHAIIVKPGALDTLATLAVEGQAADGKWTTLVPVTDLSKLTKVSAGLLLPLTGTYDDRELRRIRLNWTTSNQSPIELSRIAFYVK